MTDWTKYLKKGTVLYIDRQGHLRSTPTAVRRWTRFRSVPTSTKAALSDVADTTLLVALPTKNLTIHSPVIPASAGVAGNEL